MPKFILALTLLCRYRFHRRHRPSSSSAAAPREEQEACSRDVSRFCRPVMDQGDFTILACLQQNRPKITKACNQVLMNHGQ